MNIINWIDEILQEGYIDRCGVCYINKIDFYKLIEYLNLKSTIEIGYKCNRFIMYDKLKEGEYGFIKDEKIFSKKLKEKYEFFRHVIILSDFY